MAHPFIITVNFTDLDNNEYIAIATIFNVTTNSSDYVVVGVIHWYDGLYNITIINNDYNLDWIKITIEFGEQGYINSTVIIDIELVFVLTDVDLSSPVDNI